MPVAAVILLIYLIVFVHRLLGVLKNVNGTLKTVDQDLQKLEKPLQTVNELSETVDLVHEASRNAVRSALVTIIENALIHQGLDLLQKEGRIADRRNSGRGGCT